MYRSAQRSIVCTCANVETAMKQHQHNMVFGNVWILWPRSKQNRKSAENPSLNKFGFRRISSFPFPSSCLLLFPWTFQFFSVNFACAEWLRLFPLRSCAGNLSAATCMHDVTPLKTLGTLRSDNGDGDGNVRSLGRAGPRRVGVPAKIEITNFTSENVDDGHWCLSCLSQRKFFRKPCQSSVTLFSWLMLPVWLTLKWVPCKIRLIYDYKWKLAQWKYLYTLHRSNKFLPLIRILKMAACFYRLIRRHTSTSA